MEALKRASSAARSDAIPWICSPSSGTGEIYEPSLARRTISGLLGSGVGLKIFRPLELVGAGAALRRARVRVVGRVEEVSWVVLLCVRVKEGAWAMCARLSSAESSSWTGEAGWRGFWSG